MVRQSKVDYTYPVGVAVTDLTTGRARTKTRCFRLNVGLYAHSAILAALIARSTTGKGQKLDISLLV